jgi:preprotein translocase subunit SecE
MSNIGLIIWALLIGGAFAFAWRKGYLERLSTYWNETREELRKCNWPTWEELKESTVVISLSIAALGLFTVLADQVFFQFVQLVTKLGAS